MTTARFIDVYIGPTTTFFPFRLYVERSPFVLPRGRQIRNDTQPNRRPHRLRNGLERSVRFRNPPERRQRTLRITRRSVYFARRLFKIAEVFTPIVRKIEISPTFRTCNFHFRTSGPTNNDIRPRTFTNIFVGVRNVSRHGLRRDLPTVYDRHPARWPKSKAYWTRLVDRR